MENSNLIRNKNCEAHMYKCERCEKSFNTKSSPSLHVYQTHWQIDLLKMKMKNEPLKLNIQLFMNKSNFWKIS